jgi:hypothetical protein
MGTQRKADYKNLEVMYVTEGRSYSDIARAASISPQSVSEYGRRNDWPGKRAAYEAAMSRRGYAKIAEHVASQKFEIRNEAIQVARATLRAYAQSLINGQVVPTAKDAALMIDLLIKELTPEGSRGDEDTIVSTISPDTDFLRSVVEAARGRFSSGADVEGALLGGAQRTRAN